VLEEFGKGCREALVGCIDCKKVLFKNMTAELGPIQEKATSLRQNPDYVRDVVKKGAAECRKMACETMEIVRSALGLVNIYK
jgi:tryptophanyl-tRNA synthetase